MVRGLGMTKEIKREVVKAIEAQLVKARDKVKNSLTISNKSAMLS